MMNCTDFKNQIDDYCDGELGAELMASCEGHLASCPECVKAVKDQRDLLTNLKAMPVTGPSKGFAERVLRVAMEQEAAEQHIDHHVDSHRRGFLVGFGSAAVAALALWVVVGVFPQQTPLPGQDRNSATQMAKVEVNDETNVEKNIPEFSIALNEQREIKLAFYSAEDLQGATITLQMPENVALVGYEGQRELAWETNLAKGDNTLRLPVLATGIAGGQLVARIEYMGKVKTLKVNLAIGAPELSDGTESELRVV